MRAGDSLPTTRSCSDGINVACAKAALAEDATKSFNPMSSISTTRRATYSIISASQSPSLRGVHEASNDIACRRTFRSRHAMAVK